MPTDSVTIERLPKSRIVATIKVDEAEYAPAEAEALNLFSQHLDIKGFRPGHAPVDMVRARVPAEDLFEEAVRLLLRRTLPDIAQKENIVPVVPPKVEVVSRLPLTLKITFIERPEVTIKNVDAIKVPKKDIQPAADDIQKVIDSVLQEHRITSPVERAAAMGDQVTIDFWAADDKGTEIPGMRAEGYSAVIGSKTLLPGFEDELTGLTKEQNKSFTLTLPEKFQMAELRGKQATFHVTMKNVEKVDLPTLDDAFAKDKLQANSADAFRQMVADSLRAQEEQFERMSRERELMETIRKNVSVDIADELVEEEVRGMVEEWAQRLEAQGKTIAQALEEQKKKPEDVEKEMRADAVERWKLRLGIAKLIELKKIEVSDHDLAHAFEHFLESLPEDKRAGAQKEWDKRGNLYEEIKWRAMVDALVEQLLG